MFYPNKKSFDQLEAAIGRTPLFEITYRYLKKEYTLYAKGEYYNYTGSIKDRMAFHILKKASQTGILKEGSPIVEVTSGNTGIAISAIGSYLHHKVVIFMPDWMSKERRSMLSNFGADIHLVSKEEGGFVGSLDMAEAFAKQYPSSFLTYQFSNPDNIEAHLLTTGPEIISQMASFNKQIDAFVAGVGTGGTVMGVGKALRKHNPNVKVHPLEPASSPTLSTGKRVGSHRIQGISDEFIPDILNLSSLDAILQADDGDAILMSQKLGKELGLGVGISSGANVIGAIKAQIQADHPIQVVTVLPDDNKKYLSTDLMKEEPFQEGYLTGAIEFIDMRVIPCPSDI